MKKNEGRIFKVLRFLCLSSVIVFGLMTIVGTGSDHGSPKGVFVDSPVEGLRYESLFYIGYTNAEGKFKYIPGHTITFSVGGIELGSAVASGTLSPVDLVYGAVDETNDEVTNICIFLQTLDEDGDLNNGIRISEAIREVIEGSIINFDQTPAEFSADPNVIALLEALNAAGVFTDTVAGDRALRTAEEAQRHMRATLGNRNTINTAYGEVRGFEDECNTWCWRGIPFAKPPLDDLRWKAPMDPDSWEGVREGTEFGNECLQIDSVTR